MVQSFFMFYVQCCFCPRKAELDSSLGSSLDGLLWLWLRLVASSYFLAGNLPTVLRQALCQSYPQFHSLLPVELREELITIMRR